MYGSMRAPAISLRPEGRELFNKTAVQVNSGSHRLQNDANRNDNLSEHCGLGWFDLALRFSMQVEIASGGQRAIDAFRLGSLA